MEISKIINREIEKVFELEKEQTISDVDKLITRYLIRCWKAKKQLPNLRAIASYLAISESSISKYLLKNKMEKFLVLKYIFKINTLAASKIVVNPNHKIDQIASQIKNSKKVVFLAQGNSGLLARQFYTLLVLKNIHAVYVEGRPDQTKLISSYQESDFFIVISHSFSHSWCDDILHSNKNCLFITAKEITVKPNQFLFHTFDPSDLKSEKMSFFHLNLINQYMQKIIDLL